MKTGIYSVTSASGKRYIGSAVNFEKRWAVHQSLLSAGKHHNVPLQAAFVKYKELKFEKLLICQPDMLLIYEQLFLDALSPEYNICKIAGSRLGAKFSEATKQEMSKVRAGVKQSPEHIAKRVAKLAGKKRTPEAISAYVAMRNRPVICVETGQVFLSGKAASKWCIEQNLTTSENSFVTVNRAIQKATSAYGYRWRLLQ